MARFDAQAFLESIEKEPSADFSEEDERDLEGLFSTSAWRKASVALHIHYTAKTAQLMRADLTTEEGRLRAIQLQAEARGLLQALDYLLSLPAELALQREQDNATT